MPGSLRALAIVLRQRDVDIELVIVARTLDEQSLANRLRHLGREVDVLRELRFRAGLHVAEIGVGNHRRRLARHDHLAVLVVERRNDVFCDFALPFEHARLLAALEVDLVDEVVRRRLDPLREVLRALEVDRLVVRADEHDRRAVRTALRLKRARVGEER